MDRRPFKTSPAPTSCQEVAQEFTANTAHHTIVEEQSLILQPGLNNIGFDVEESFVSISRKQSGRRAIQS